MELDFYGPDIAAVLYVRAPVVCFCLICFQYSCYIGAVWADIVWPPLKTIAKCLEPYRVYYLFSGLHMSVWMRI